MRKVLDDPVYSFVTPPDLRVASLEPGRRAEAHALLNRAYADGQGAVAALDVWWDGLTADEEYDPDLILAVTAPDGALVGVVQCWTSAFIKDLAVHPDWRRRGVGRTLVEAVFAAFRGRGAAHVDLKVQQSNDAAIQLYRAAGMTVVPGG